MIVSADAYTHEDTHTHTHACAHTHTPVYDATIEDGQVVLGFLVLLAFNVAFGIIASTLIVIEVRYLYMYTVDCLG